MHVSSVYGIPYIPTTEPKPIQVLNIFEKVYGLKPKKEEQHGKGFTMGIDCGDKTDKSTIIIISTPNNKKGFFYEPIYGTYAWNNMNLEANQFATLPKTTWYGESSLDRIIDSGGKQVDECDPWNNLSDARKYASDTFAKAINGMIFKDINRPKINFNHV